MQQSRLVSLIETSLNTALGFLISFSAWPFVAAWRGLPSSTSDQFWITCAFTVLSVARGYAVRRWFNNGLHMLAYRAATRITFWRKNAP
jgi:phosphate/sulfate permease